MPKLPKSIKLPGQLLQESRGSLKAVYKHSQALLAIQAIVNEVVDPALIKPLPRFSRNQLIAPPVGAVSTSEVRVNRFAFNFLEKTFFSTCLSQL